MVQRMFTDFDLGERIRQGKSVREIADEFGVTPRAIYRRAERLRVKIGKEVALHQAGKVLAREVDMSLQMRKMIAESEFMMGKLGSYIRKLTGDDEFARQEAKAHLAAAGDDLLAGKSLVDLMIKSQGEHRQQLSLMLDVAERLIQFQQVNDFMLKVYEIVQQISPSEQAKVVQALRDLGAIINSVPRAGRLI